MAEPEDGVDRVDESDDCDVGRGNGPVDRTVGGADDDRRATAVDPAAIFEDVPADRSFVSERVDALFERFEEDTPEEVMVADRHPGETDVVPAPPEFEAFADDLVAPDEPRPTAGARIDAEWTEDAMWTDEVVWADGDGQEWLVTDETIPAPGDVVGFEDAPDPTDDGVGQAPAAGDLTDVDQSAASGDADGSFEWVTDPVVTETVLADPDAARTYASPDRPSLDHERRHDWRTRTETPSQEGRVTSEDDTVESEDGTPGSDAERDSSSVERVGAEEERVSVEEERVSSSDAVERGVLERLRSVFSF